MNNYEQNDMKKDEDLGLHFPLFLFVWISTILGRYFFCTQEEKKSFIT